MPFSILAALGAVIAVFGENIYMDSVDRNRDRRAQKGGIKCPSCGKIGSVKVERCEVEQVPLEARNTSIPFRGVCTKCGNTVAPGYLDRHFSTRGKLELCVYSKFRATYRQWDGVITETPDYTQPVTVDKIIKIESVRTISEAVKIAEKIEQVEIPKDTLSHYQWELRAVYLKVYETKGRFCVTFRLSPRGQKYL